MTQIDGPPFPDSVERRVVEIGHSLSRTMKFSRNGLTGRLQDRLVHEMTANTQFRQRLLRFVDVFAAIHTHDSRLIKDMFSRYLAEGDLHVSRSTGAAIRAMTALPAPVLSRLLRLVVRSFARRFIVPDDAHSVEDVALQPETVLAFVSPLACGQWRTHC